MLEGIQADFELYDFLVFTRAFLFQYFRFGGADSELTLRGVECGLLFRELRLEQADLVL